MSMPQLIWSNRTQVVGAPVSTHKGTLRPPLWHHVISMGSSEATEHCPDMQALGSEGSWLLEMPRLDHTGLISS